MAATVRRWARTSACAGLVLAGGILTAAASGAVLDSHQPPAAAEASQSGPSLQMVAADAELQDSINAKKAKQGDRIRARISEKVKLSDGKELPKDTVLEGQIDQVQPSEHKSDSTVVVTFAKALLKGGTELHIKATLLSIWEPQEAVSGDMGSGGAMPGSQMSQSGAGPKIPSTSNVMSQGRAAVPGVVLHGDVHDTSSATFTGEHGNVNLPSGTRMRFAVLEIPEGMDIQ